MRAGISARVGYACITRDVEDTALKSCILKNASEEKLTALIANNLKALENMLAYNYENDIRLFRISSELIPFGSSPVNTLSWGERFEKQWDVLGAQIKKYAIRVSMHPGQYTVLNSPDGGVTERAVADLLYHQKVLDLLGTESESKIVLHIGGVYGDKKSALQRFCESWKRLPDSLLRRIVLENDERSYTIAEVLELCTTLGVPAIFDNLHNSINPAGNSASEKHWIELCRKTWKEEDGRQKIHYAQQSPGGRVGAHSDTIDTEKFLRFYEDLSHKDTDIMLEVKDKNLSALKCIKAIEEL